MIKFYLNVPFSEKEAAKSKGARWDPINKKWYIDSEKNSLPFINWIPEISESKYNLYSSYFYIAESKKYCWNCDEEITVYAIVLPSDFKYKHVQYIDDDIGTDFQNKNWIDSCDSSEDFYVYKIDVENSEEITWNSSGTMSFAWYIRLISKDALDKVNEITTYFKLGYSKTAKTWYFSNHCSKCNRLQGDWMLYDEPGGTFFPLSISMAEMISLRKINVPIYVNATFSYSTDSLFDFMTYV